MAHRLKNLIFASINSNTLIQRIQTLFMLLAGFGSLLGAFVFPLWIGENAATYADDTAWIQTTFLASAVLGFYTIFKFKKRKNQFVLNRLGILVNFILLGFFVYQSLTISGEAAVSEKGIGLLMPVVSIAFLALANRAIKKDEALVKSADRLR